ncbi:hypothetical protein [Phytobacter diazotrophicus]|uniref:hypothetical protein n=1 Tax=Phytobacter diazotrophicus TaxID=395631 RepID=UPI002914C232|nr:hypothetical protein [Enterobacteriaceae bacterium]
MRKFSIYGAVFIFMNRGEKLKESDVTHSNHWPAEKYVLWPRGEYWDVRFRVRKGGKWDWLPIAEKPFANEATAWQAASEHWLKHQANILR